MMNHKYIHHILWGMLIPVFLFCNCSHKKNS